MYKIRYLGPKIIFILKNKFLFCVFQVYVDLNPLLLPNVSARSSGGGNDKLSVSTAAGGGVLSGWVPIFDTMHGIRGEINFIVKVSYS